MAIKFTNNAVGTLALSISDIETSISVSGTEGSRFPTLTGSDYFYATLVDQDGNREILKVTARTGNTMTVVRAQEGTSARAFDAGSRVSHRLTAVTLDEFAQKGTGNTFAEDQTIAKASADAALAIRANAGQIRALKLQTGNEDRWRIEATNDSEDGDEVGSDFAIKRYDDDGVLVGSALTISRSTGQIKHGSNVADSFPSGTRMLFHQSAAPTGWTKDASINDKALRVVSGTASSGGTTSFSNVFAARTIDQENLPDVELAGTAASTGAHRHFMWANTTADDSRPTSTTQTAVERTGGSGDAYQAQTSSTDATLGQTSSAGAHSHDVTVALGGSGTALDFDVQYEDVIIAQKD